MPFRIQRVPRGLNDLLNIFGGTTPTELEDRVQSSLELLQLYGLTQLQTASASDAALAEGGTVSLTMSATRWTVLFAAQVGITKTATMTALRGSILLNRSLGVAIQLKQEECGPFGATESGFIAVAHWCPYPVLCPPGSIVQGSLAILGTDATANVSVRAEFGVLG